MSELLEIRVVTFGSAVAALGFQTHVISVADGTTVAQLIEQLEVAFPQLVQVRGRIRIAVNFAYAAPNRILQHDDEVALIPPVSGGSGEPIGPAVSAVRLTNAPIDVSALLDEVAHQTNGAVCAFLGVVRAEKSALGQELHALEYTAYDAMAIAEMERILAAVVDDGEISTAIVVHRLGILTVGEASIAVVVASPHRAESFEVCRGLIEQVKASVPIFKREIWADQSQTWVDPV
jgi:MoaE-MoaD fusion protein